MENKYINPVPYTDTARMDFALWHTISEFSFYLTGYTFFRIGMWLLIKHLPQLTFSPFLSFACSLFSLRYAFVNYRDLMLHHNIAESRELFIDDEFENFMKEHKITDVSQYKKALSKQKYLNCYLEDLLYGHNLYQSDRIKLKNAVVTDLLLDEKIKKKIEIYLFKEKSWVEYLYSVWYVDELLSDIKQAVDKEVHKNPHRQHKSLYYQIVEMTGV